MNEMNVTVKTWSDETNDLQKIIQIIHSLNNNFIISSTNY
jgi:hypothetical protein